MDTNEAAVTLLESGWESGLAPYATGNIPWITFGGSPNESSTAFVQSIHRVGFQQGRGRDDGWMAEYAATCFEGDALIWYTGLDDETQENWKKLRANLLRKYPHVAGEGAPPLFSMPQPASIPSGPVGVGTSSVSSSNTQGLVGRIEVLANDTLHLSQGYLSCDPNLGIGITTEKSQAAIISFPIGKGLDVLQMEMLNISRRVLPYLGLALMLPQGKDPNIIPCMLPGITGGHYNTYGYGTYGYGTYGSSMYGGHSRGNRPPDPIRYQGIPEPSSICKHLIPVDSSHATYTKVEFATWTFSACGESAKASLYRRRSPAEVSGTRAAAAVWKYDKSTEEVTLHWLMDDDTECELGGFVHQGTSGQLHVHRLCDMDHTGTRDYILEERVRFVLDVTQ